MIEKKKNKTYTLLISGLKDGTHVFEFDIDNGFFEAIEYSEIKKGQLRAEVRVTRQSALLLLDFHIMGFVNVICDRCLDNFNLPTETTQRLVVKVGASEEINEEDEGIIHFPANEKELDIRQYLYEYIILSLPIRRVHPEQEGKDGCDPDVIQKLKKVLVNGQPEAKSEDKPEDPRWDALKKLKFNSKN